MRKLSFLGAVIYFAVILTVHANAAFVKLTCDDADFYSGETTLVIGQETSLKIWGFVPSIGVGNGIDAWQMDLMIADGSDSDVMEVKMNASEADVTIYAPNPNLGGGMLFPNSPESGAGSKLGASGFGTASDVGILQYDLLAEVTVTAIAEGTIEYQLGAYDLSNPFNYYIGLVDFTTYAPIFDEAESNTVFHVIPEPATLFLALTGGLFLRRRKA